MSTAVLTDPSASRRLRWVVSDTAALVRRNLAHIRQVPEKLIDVTVQPLMFVLLFAYVFGGAIHVPGGHYREYLMGGIFIQTIAFGIVGPATAIATDMGEGIVDRLRSLPMARSAFLLGHAVAEFAGLIVAIAIMSVAGLITGWRIHTDLVHALAGYGLLMLFAVSMVWTGMLLGVVARAADAVTGVAFLVVFPLTFIANAFVPVGSLPGVLKTFAEWNPVSTLAQAVRQLFGNPAALPAHAPWPLQHPVVTSVGWCLLILAVTVPLAILAYRRRTAG